MRSLAIYKYALIAALAVSSMTYANEDEQHIQPGVRALSHAQWMEIHQEREDKEDAAEVQQELNQAEEEAEASIKSTEAAKVNASTFYTSHTGAFHNPYSVSYLGDYVVLEDGSGWSISSSDTYKTLNWLTSDLIVITANADWFSSYMFRMTNQNTGVSVKCNLSMGPIYNGVYTHWIVGINYFTQEICLEDGSIWKVTGFDSSIFNTWLINDTIVIGVNDAFLSSSRPNILINVNTLTYVRANCTY